MPDCTVEVQNRLTTRFVSGTFYLALLNDTRYNYSFTVSGNVLTTSSNHNYLLNTKVQVDVSGGGALPAPLVSGTVYYARDIGSNTLTLSATYGGAVITLTTIGTGTFTIVDIATDYTILDVSNYIRQETNYQGVSARPFLNFAGGIVTTPTTVSLSETVLVDNTAGTNPIVFNSLLLIRGGSATIGNTTGYPCRFTNLGATSIIAAGAVDSVQVPISTTLGV